ncbi:MAG: 2-oxo acid dehydrogenase subunit E2 [Candidatus Delongbacteria bacterium]
MAIIITLPDLGENIKAGELTALLVKPGDPVRADSPVLELETDKAVVEVPAGRAGRVLEWLARVGERLEVGAALLSLEEAAEADGAPAASVATAEPAPAAAPPPAPDLPVTAAPAPAPAAPPVSAPSSGSVAPGPPPGEHGLPVPASPTVRRLARELGVDIRRVAGAGPGGRISREDVKAHVKELLARSASVDAGGPGLPAEDLPDFSRWGAVEELPLSGVRRTTARHLASAWLLTPRVTQQDRADITELEAFRKRQQALLDRRPDAPRLTMTAILIRVLAQALRQFPQVNASLDLGREKLIRKHYCHVGVAVDTERGLLVPVLRDADHKGVLQLARELGELSRRARERKSGPEELQGACVTLTNLGGIGGTGFTPIVNHPEAAILGVSRASVEPVWNEATRTFEPRLLLPLSLSYDHRIVDGADGARFTRWICEALESPLLLVF